MKSEHSGLSTFDELLSFSCVFERTHLIIIYIVTDFFNNYKDVTNIFKYSLSIHYIRSSFLTSNYNAFLSFFIIDVLHS